AKILAIPCSRGPSQPRDQTWVSCISRQVLYQLSHQEAHCPCLEVLIFSWVPGCWNKDLIPSLPFIL
ncbi:unnamed protein product, partial [Rangifer tarandus platyrhynchus]